MRSAWGILLLLVVLIAVPRAASAAPACPRPAAGSVVQKPPELYSRNGVLAVSFDYLTSVDAAGLTLFCFVTPDGLQSPTLHVKPGDMLELTVTNRIPAPPPAAPTERVSNATDKCGDAVMTITSVNVHFHGTNTPPACHGDQVVHTIINSGETFKYSLKIPADEPPGLYWYHPHVHGISEAAVLGGASGALIVDGIETLQPSVVGLNQRLLVIRDQNLAAKPGADAPSWDISLNYVPVLYPAYTPSLIRLRSGARELWRVVNASADTIVELVLTYDGVAQPMSVVALDGVPTGSQDGSRTGTALRRTSIRLAPAARAEFVMTAPAATVRKAMLVTRRIDTGPLGDSDPARPLATIQTIQSIQPGDSQPIPPPVPGAVGPQRFEGLLAAAVTAKRTVYFSETVIQPPSGAAPLGRIRPDWSGDDALFRFFITVAGQVPTLFDPNNPPAITTTQGAVEDWTIQNHSRENHEFHMHQIHFLVLARNGVAVPKDQQQFYDTMEVPYWTGQGPYPSLTVRMDFRGADIGDFVYHCHILGHEDAGMMAIIRVLAPS